MRRLQQMQKVLDVTQMDGQKDKENSQKMNLIHIDDLKCPELALYASTSEAGLLHRFEPAEGVFIAESPKVIERALADGYEPISFLLEEKDVLGQMAHVLAKYESVPVYTSTEDVLLGITGFKLTRGALCAMRRRKLPEIQQVVRDARRIVVLENVMNPTNVGAIFRSAAALGLDAVLLTRGCSDPLYRRAIRVSMGTVFQIPWTFIRDSNEMRCKREVIWPKQVIAELKKLGYKTAALALTDDSVSIDDSELMKEEKLAVILGNEGEGLENGTIALCDYTVKIPMTHGVDSLNVAAASAVAFWQLGKIIL